jgi:hypothetical protein
MSLSLWYLVLMIALLYLCTVCGGLIVLMILDLIGGINDSKEVL